MRDASLGFAGGCAKVRNVYLAAAMLENSKPKWGVNMKTSICICIIFVLLCGITGTAKAGTTFTAGELLRDCKEAVAKDAAPDQDRYMAEHAFEIGLCDGFVAGWFEATRGMIFKSEDRFYKIGFADDVTVGQIIRVFVVYTQKHPEIENKSGDSGLVDAVSEAKLVTFTPVKASTAKNASASAQ